MREIRYYDFGELTMRYQIICSCLLMFGSAIAEEHPDFRVSVYPLVEGHFGKTEYIYEEVGLADVGGTPTLFSVKSQLEYPLDCAVAGGRVEIQYFSQGRPEIGCSVGIMANAETVTGKMRDRDWIDDRLVGDTDSEARTWFFQLDLEISKRLAGRDSLSLFVVGGFRLQRISQDLVGLDGRYFNDSTRIWDPVHLEVPVGGYEITYSLPFVGLKPQIQRGSLTASVKAAMVLVFASDQDHHLLRNFTGEAKGSGSGFMVNGQARLSLGHWRPSGSVYAVLSADLMHLRVDTSEKVTFYGYDSGTENDLGDVLENLPHEIKSTQYGMSLGIGLTF
ncbi:MAG: omptin family outer membrane protease [Candidatus Zixiibacteriota bacterium]|nr:MAG: omptin family outer membrane protease [candidate division Zixibacteria bacterium]